MDKKEQEFNLLAQRHKETIYSVCMMFAEDQGEIDDLMQESLIHLWRGFGTFRGEAEEKSWVYKVTLNTCITLSNQKRNRQEKEAEAPSIIAQSDDAKQMVMLHQRIHRLKVFDRAIILLWLEDLSYEEIGRIVGISPKNVSVRLVRIREELKNMSNS